mmetsp:Transcript_9270/g.37476  ORF Transcript_9270/g.37476 Transcript_9270/m.37476 type:complete len:337 (+) Transcript_9270:1069-2079(+)
MEAAEADDLDLLGLGHRLKLSLHLVERGANLERGFVLGGSLLAGKGESLLRLELLHGSSAPARDGGVDSLLHELLSLGGEVARVEAVLDLPPVRVGAADVLLLKRDIALLRHHDSRHERLADPKPRHELGVTTEEDIGTATGHVGGDGHGAAASSLRDNLSLALDVLRLCVEELVRDAILVEELSNLLGPLHGGGTHEHGSALLVHARNLRAHRVPLAALGAEDDVLGVVALHLPVGGNNGDGEVVDVVKLGQLRLGGAGHASELGERAEESLVGDGRDGHGLVLNRETLLGFDSLVQAVGPATADHGAAGELVDDDHLAPLHDVIDVLELELLSL